LADRVGLSEVTYRFPLYACTSDGETVGKVGVDRGSRAVLDHDPVDVCSRHTPEDELRVVQRG
jgi:hypothetical protein